MVLPLSAVTGQIASWPDRSQLDRSSSSAGLQRQAESPAIVELADYVSSTWINGTTRCPSDWTVFKQAVRTNNDLEGWESWPQP